MPEKQRRLAGAPETPFDSGEQAAPAAPQKPRANPEPLAETPRTEAELAVIDTLREIAVAQEQFQASAKADEDKDGIGQFGSFGELSGAKSARDNGYMLKPLLPPEFGEAKESCVDYKGYRFRMFQPTEGGQPVAERPGGGYGRHQTDPDLSEAYWCVYAWPAKGKGRAYFICQDGNVIEGPTGVYSGDVKPDEYAAYKTAQGMHAPPCIDSTGRDRHHWKIVE